MKNNLSSPIITMFILFFFTCFGYSQEEKLFNENIVWLKNVTSDTIVKQDDNLKEKIFNFNNIINFSANKISKKMKNIVKKKSSLFVVFRSSCNEESNLVSIEKGTFKCNLSNKKMICDKEVQLNRGDLKTGVLVSYLFNKNSLVGRRNGNLVFDDVLYDDKNIETQMAELLYIPKLLSNKEKEIVETYLSLKYGISLDMEQNYYNSKGEKIWSSKENESYNYRVTGFGRDDFFELNQKQSKNALLDGLTIGLNKIEKTNIKNKSNQRNRDFFIWGDNGKKIVLEKDQNDNQKKMQRVWKLKTISDSINGFKTQFKIDKSLMPIDVNLENKDSEFIWLAIDKTSSSEINFSNAKYIKATINNEKEIVIDNVEFDSNSDYFFTIVKARENEINSNLNALINPLKLVEETTNLNGHFTIFPNPIDANEKFSIQFNLKEDSKVLIRIADANGKIIKIKDLGSIRNYLFTESLNVSGTYLILVSIDDKLETSKLIVK